MKTIKFRAWDKVFNRMADFVEYISFAGNKINEVKIGYRDFLNGQEVHPLTYYRKLDEVVLMQYTGKKDKNKKKIYEYDILTKYNHNYIVEFKGAFCIAHEVDYKPASLAAWSWDSAEKIGNKFENPELMKNG